MRLIRFLKVVVTLCLILFSSKAFAGFTEGLTFARAGNFDAAIGVSSEYRTCSLTIECVLLQ